MPEARIGRLLPACLHQAIADVLPQRLDFYENWLRSETLRDGDIGVAPMTAVLGFLRTEHAEYGAVVARAGALAAEWTVASLRRRLIDLLPRPLRTRVALRIARKVARRLYSPTRMSVRIRGRRARLDIASSVFCGVRERHPGPLCGFYGALATGILRAFRLPARSVIESCRGAGAAGCVLELTLSDETPAADTAIAA